MKKIVVLLLAITLFGCSNNDDSDNIPVKNGDILGKWYYKERIVDGVTIPYDDHEACGKDYLEFYDVSKIRSVDIWDCEESVDWTGTFTKEEDILTFYIGDENVVTEIVELSEHVLSYVFYVDENGDGVDEEHIQNFER